MPLTTNPDPRPRVTDADSGEPVTVAGASCHACELATLSSVSRCPSCGEGLETARFGPGGTVWSSTVVRVPIPGRTPPYAVAYVDLDDGPRLLCHLDSDERPAVGSRVRLAGTTVAGDVLVRATP